MGIEFQSMRTGATFEVSYIFGEKDALRLERACEQVLKNCWYPYAGCYISPEMPRISEFRSRYGGDMRTVSEKVREWCENHPDEVEREASSRKHWEEEAKRQFRIIYGIARRHHVYLEWCGPRVENRWIVLKYGWPIGIIETY